MKIEEIKPGQKLKHIEDGEIVEVVEILSKGEVVCKVKAVVIPKKELGQWLTATGVGVNLKFLNPSDYSSLQINQVISRVDNPATHLIRAIANDTVFAYQVMALNYLEHWSLAENG